MRNEVLRTLSRLVSMPTVSHRPVTEIAAYLAERAESVGFRVYHFETTPGKTNMVAIAGPDEGDGLVLSGHMDVVPVDGQQWDTDPFRTHSIEGRIHGRGTCDMKGFIAAVTEAIDADLIRSLRKPLALIWTHDEEVGCIGSAALASQLAQLDRPLPKLAWIGEPTDFRICNLHPGHAAFEINCIGRAAHSSRPSLGLNAIELASRVCIALSELQHTLRTERKFEEQLDAPFTILNLAQIHGGVAVNIVPNQCSLRIGARPLPGQSAEDILERIRNTLSPLDEEVRKRGGRIEIEPGDATPSLYTKPTCDLMSSLCVHASHPEPIGAPFATDGGNLTTLGMETLIFGPGSIDQAHRANEFIPEDDLFRTVKFVEQVVRTRCGV